MGWPVMWSFPGPMRRCVMQAQIKRTLTASLPALGNVFNRATSEQISHVANALDRNFTFIEIEITYHVLVREEICRAAHDSVELIKTTFSRTEVWQISQVPFAD